MISSSAAWTYQIPVTLPKTLSQQPRKEEGPLLLQRHQEDCEAVVRVVSQPANWQTHISSRTRGLSDFRLKSLLGFDPTTNIGRNINNSNNNTINNTNYGNENMSEWCYEEETPVNNRSVERRSSPYAFSEQFHSHYQLQQQQQLEEQLHFIENTHSLSLLEEKTCSASACRRSVNSIKCTFADCRRKFPSE